MSPYLKILFHILRDRRGGIAPIAAVVGIVMVLAAGSAVDVGRAARLRSLLQDDADNAALAGAAQSSSAAATTSAQAYVNAAVANLTDKPTVTPTYTYDSTTNPASPSMTVVLKATLPTTLMSVVTPTIPISVSAKAAGMVQKQFTINLTNYSSDAADTNIIYGFGYDPTVYAAGTSALYTYAPKSTADNKSWTCIVQNKQPGVSPYADPSCTTTMTATMTIPWNYNVAFALKNTTGNYTNCYGQSSGQTAWYYSTRTDASGQYHETPTSNFSWCGYSSTSGGIVYGNSTTCKSTYYWYGNYYCNSSYNGQIWNKTYYAGTAYVYAAGTASARNPLILSNNTQDCTAMNGVTYSWDDNGGNPDDSDFNDMVFTVSCTKVVGGGPARLVG